MMKLENHHMETHDRPPMQKLALSDQLKASRRQETGQKQETRKLETSDTRTSFRQPIGKLDLSEQLKQSEQKETKEEEKRETGKARVRETKKTSRALREINLKEYSENELRETEELSRKQSFVDGHGDRISYHDAADTMINDLRSSLNELKKSGREISDEQIKAICEDARKTIYSQEAESESRALNHHGIPHLYGVYERMKDVDQKVLETAAENIRQQHPESRATAADVRAALVMAPIFHDEGYLSDASDKSTDPPRRDDTLHGVDSAISFEHTHAPLYKGVVDQAVLADIRQAILEHNVVDSEREHRLRGQEQIPEGGARDQALGEFAWKQSSDLNPNHNFIRSTLLLSDKMAADTEEKVPDVLRDPDRLKIVARYYYIAQEQGLLQKGHDETQARLANEALRKELSASVQGDDSLQEVQKQHYLEAIQSDISIQSGRFVLPLTTVVTPADAVKFSVEDGQIHAKMSIRVMADDPEIAAAVRGASGDQPLQPGELPMEGKKALGILGDIGITRDVLTKEATGQGVWLEMQKEEENGKLESSGVLLAHTENLEYLSHVTVEIQSVEPETEKPELSESVQAALEAKEEFNEARKQAEIREEATAAFQKQCEQGEAGNEQAITMYLSAVYDDTVTNPELDREIDAICAELDSLRLSPDKERMDALVERVRGLKVRSGSEIRGIPEKGKS